MINKRLLIKNLLAHNDENSFYDKKQKLSLSNKEGKAKFLKHIVRCQTQILRTIPILLLVFLMREMRLLVLIFLMIAKSKI